MGTPAEAEVEAGTTPTGVASFNVECSGARELPAATSWWKSKIAIAAVPSISLMVVVVVLVLALSGNAKVAGGTPPPSAKPRPRRVIHCPSGSGSCLPGIKEVGWGFDVLTGARAAQAVPIMQYTYNQNKTFGHPTDHSLVWDVPDQLDAIWVGRLEESAETTVVYSASQMGHHLQRGVSLSGGGVLPEFGMSLSTEVETASTVLGNYQAYSSFASSSLFGIAYQVNLARNPEPHPLFLTALLSLPQNYTTSTKSEFLAFIQKYGTHYVTTAYFGGYSHMSSSVSRQSTQTEVETSIQTQASEHMNFELLQQGASITGSSSDASSWFMADQQTQFSIDWVGGVPNLESSFSQWQSWYDTVYSYPVLVYKDTHKVMLESVLSFIPPNLGGQSTSHIQSNLQTALADYYGQHPFLADPPCMQQIWTLNGACCTQAGQTQSCTSDPNTCYDPTKSKCCNSAVIGLQDTCCGSFSCANGAACCGSSCVPQGGICCSSGSSSFTCNSGQQCCNWYCIDSQASCCSDGSGEYCGTGEGQCCAGAGGNGQPACCSGGCCTNIFTQAPYCCAFASKGQTKSQALAV